MGLREALSQVPDPRSARGIRHSLAAVLTMTVCAMLGGARSLYAMAQWGREHRQLDGRQAGPGFGQAGEEGGLVLGACRQFQQTPGLRPVLRLAPVQPVRPKVLGDMALTAAAAMPLASPPDRTRPS